MGNVFNRYGAGGGKSEGLYIWKKYEYKPAVSIVNPSFTANINSTTLTILETNGFDVKDIASVGTYNVLLDVTTSAEAQALADFFLGFKVSGLYSFEFMLNSNTLRLVYSSMYYMNVYSYENTNSWFRGDFSSAGTKTGLTFTYNGTKTLPAKIGEFVGYVVSDKEDAYPDKEVKDGFYYERYSALDPALFGCTKYETGAVSVTSRVPTITVSHSMGVKPKFAFVWKSRAQGTQYCRAVAITYSDDGIYCAMSNWGNSGSNTNGSVYNTASGASTLSDVTLVSDASNNYYKFYSGGYSYILLG
jgi:hypothetical protein